MTLQSITIRRPDDWHVHLRDGEMLDRVARYTARQFARAIVMPNLVPPITNADDAAAYRDRIVAEIEAAGVPCFSGSCSEVYLEKAFEQHPSRPLQRLPVAQELGESSLMFLVHPTLEPEHIDRTAAAARAVLKRAMR